MMEKIYDGSARPLVYQLARAAVQGVPEYDDLGEIKAVARAVKRRVRFTRDPWRIEALQDPEDTLSLGAGDCDDLAILAGAALQSIGHPVTLEVVGMENKPSHVFLTSRTRRGNIIPIDLARPDGNFFAQPPPWNYRRLFALGASPVRPAAVPPRVARKRALHDALTAKKAVASIPAGYAGENIGSWLSEGIEKTFGDAGKAVNKTAKQAAGATGATAAGIASLLPGGAALSKGITMLTTAGAMGQDPRKMSWETINTIAAQDPALGAQLAEQKRNYETQKAGQKQAKTERQKMKLAAQRAKLSAMRKPVQAAPPPAPAKSNTALILGGLGLAALFMMKGK